MTSKNWPRRSALACATISLAAALASGQPAAPPPEAKVPAIVLPDRGDLEQWRKWAAEVHWQVIAPDAPANQPIDLRVQALQKAAADAVRNSNADPERIYIAGAGPNAAAVFYAISRLPDVFAAGLAAGGSPQPAIDSNRIFTANFHNTPVLWLTASAEDRALAEKLGKAGLNLEFRDASQTSMAAVFEWLATHRREEFPVSVDCETNSPNFANCWWLRMTKFDAAQRNDVLPLTLIPPRSGAVLDLGGFGYKIDDPGPGVLVSFLPEKYNGPLKMDDRIVSMDGRPIENARQFADTLEKATGEKDVAIMVERGKSRKRIETRIVLPKREPVVTARAQGRFVTDAEEIQIITRAVTELRVRIPPQWLPATLYWNGLSMEQLKTPGCLDLAMDRELLHSKRCE